MIGHKLNGFTVIAAVRDLNRPTELVILAERNHAATGRPMEYVTARMPFDGAPLTPAHEWHAGHYIHVHMDDPLGTRAYTSAVRDMVIRAGLDDVLVSVPA